MIICYINKKQAYPAQSDIKITLQNPFIKDGDDKTMEVVFPMDIPENREIFGAINRLDTHFRMENFEDCRLLADGVEVIYGTGTITSVTNNEVKLQILSGKSYLRYKAGFQDVFIDEIYYGELKTRHQHLNGKPQRSKEVFDLTGDLNDHGFIGEPGMYAFLPIHDEDNDLHVNMPSYLYDDDRNAAGISITFKAIQPSLMFVMGKVMERLGYQIERNEFDREPWNRLYVASAKMTLVMSRALPHWSAYKFLDEFRKLFNAAFLFDEQRKCVSIVPFGESGNAGYEYIEPLEEFSTSFDEEGLEYLGSSNLQYELSECDRDHDMISQEVMKAFPKKEYDNINDLYADFGSMPEREKLTTIFKCPAGFFYGIPVYNDNGQAINHLLQQCGWFSPLVRTEDGSTVQLSIVPVAVKAQKAHCVSILVTDRYSGKPGWSTMGGQEYEYDSLEANISCDYPANQNVELYSDGDTENTNNAEYVTLQDVIENGEAIPEKGSEEDVMEVFFAAGTLLTTSDLNIYGVDKGTYPVQTVHQPIAFTDYSQAVYYTTVPRWSLALNPYSGAESVGLYHNRGIRIRQNVNGNNEVIVKFLFDGKPDPRKIYIIRNRKFVCSHIDMAVGETGIDKVKTGYFHEILS